MQFSWLETGCLSSIAPSSSFVDLHLASLDPSARYTNNAVACKPYWSQSEPPCTCPVSSDQELPSATPSNESACSDDSGIQNVSIPHNSTTITVDIDKIMAKIDQDNRILAELDKTRSTIGKIRATKFSHFHYYNDSRELKQHPFADFNDQMSTCVAPTKRLHSTFPVLWWSHKELDSANIHIAVLLRNLMV